MRILLSRLLLFVPVISILFLLTAARPSFAVGPTLVHPADNSTQYVTLPAFDWEDFVGDPYAGSYEIQIDDSSSLSSPIISFTVPALVSFYSPNPSQELAPGTYYWQVRYVPVTGLPSDWSQRQFTRSDVPLANVYSLDSTPTWQEVNQTLRDALDEHPEGAVELRFPEGSGDITLIQPECPTNTPRTECPSSDDDSPVCQDDEENDYLFHVRQADNVIVNGMNRTIVIQARRRTAGVYFAQGANHLQLKDLTIDYAPDSLSQFGGEIVAIDAPNLGFTVEVDSTTYGNEAEFEPVQCGFFVDAEHHQRIGKQGVIYDMNETWQGARAGTTDTYNFTAFSQGQWNLYAGELEVGDHFVSVDRGGDVIFLKAGVTDFVASNVTTKASRGRYLVAHNGANVELIRSLGNHFTRLPARILGSASGGVNDHGTSSWYEQTTIESTRDDAFHTGNPTGSQTVLLDSEIIAAYRNSVWLHADRSWIEGNTISHAGTYGISLGGAGQETPDGSSSQIQFALIKDNTIISPRRNGIISRPPVTNAPDPKNRDIALIGNTVRDHQSNEAFRLESLAESVVSGNKVESTGVAVHAVPLFDPAWRIYSDPSLQKGFHFINSQDVSGGGNEVTDPRIACLDRLVVDSTSSNVTVSRTAASTGLHESWNCAALGSFTAPGTLTGDHTWAIAADNFEVEVLDSTLLGSRGFGRVVNDVLPLKSATALDTHTVALPQTLSPATSDIRLQARFIFNELTTLGRGEARFGIRSSSTGQLYEIGLLTGTAGSPVQLYAVNTNAPVAVGAPGDQDISGVWQVDAIFHRVSSTSTTVEYEVRRPNGAAYTGNATFANAVSSSAAFDQGFIAFKQRGQVVFDWIQITAVD